MSESPQFTLRAEIPEGSSTEREMAEASLEDLTAKLEAATKRRIDAQAKRDAKHDELNKIIIKFEGQSKQSKAKNAVEDELKKRYDKACGKDGTMDEKEFSEAIGTCLFYPQGCH